MKVVFGLVIAALLSGCSAHSWSRIDCPDFKGPPRQGFADLLGCIHWPDHPRSLDTRVRHRVKEQMPLSLQMEMENMELLQSDIPFSNERMRLSNPIKTDLGKPAVSKNLKAKKIIEAEKVVRNIRNQAVVRSEGKSSGAAAQEKRQIPFATVLGILSLGFSLLGWSLLSGGGFGIFLSTLGVVGGCLSILIGLFGLNKGWKRAARWAILLGLLAILLNPITFLIAFYGA